MDKKTNVFIVGISGKMGNMICECIGDFAGLCVSGGLDVRPHPDFPTFSSAEQVNVPIDVIVDFSRPETLESVIVLAEKFSCPVVLATTGYDAAQQAKIEALSQKHAVFQSGNMSLGVTLLCELVKQTAAALGENFDVEIVEKHHNQKVDAPSGTAHMLAQAACDGSKQDSRIVEGRSGRNCKRQKGDVGISAVRGGTIVGEHDVLFCGNDEIVTLSHTALSRKVFAVGALKAATFLCGRPCGTYSMKDVVKG